MALAPGTRLGPYEIVDRIGAGAMGEVYSARDARLHRRVAIKVLPTEFSRVPDRIVRFSQEAKAAAALNHPGVVSIFDVGLDGDVAYVVSELLEGETLRALLSRGRIPRKRAGDLAAQMASGMAAAHLKGIVHRDLKPENVFITHEGRAKILDFGLARLLAPGESAMASAADTMAVTSPGMVLGTVGYMAPEQVRGEPADQRSDIFAFGAVFYEMLAGHPAFSGGSAVERMHAVLQHDPPEITPGTIPDPFERIARRCLEKNPAQRFQSADDVAFAIEAMSNGNATPAAREGREQPEGREGNQHSKPHALPLAAMGAGAVPRRPLRWQGALAIGAAAAVGLALGFGLSRGWAGRAASDPSRVVVPSFEARTFDRLPITNARFMPDGQTIVYSAPARGDLPPDLFIINANAEAPQPLGVSHAHLLSVSSKGELALLTNATPFAHRLHAGTLARMTIGSSPRPIMEQVREADWSPDGASLAIVHDLGNGRDRLEYPAGTRLHEASGYLSDPRVSPDGSRVAFVEHPWRFDDRGVVKMVDRTGRVTTLTGELWGVQGLAWSPDGSRIVFSGNPTGGSLMQPMSVSASPASAEAADAAGTARAAGAADAAGRDTPSPTTAPANGGAQPLFGVPGRFIVHDVARDGRMLAVREDLIFGVRVSVPGTASGGVAPAPDQSGASLQGRERDLSWLGSAGARGLSRDGAWLLMVDIGLRSGRDYGVLLRSTGGSQPIRLGEGNPRRLSPDGKWAAAFLDAPARLVLYPTGSGDAIKLNAAPIERLTSVDWFPDGRRLLVCGSEVTRAPRCYTQDLSGGVPKPLTAECRDATLAPDGRTLLLTLQDGSWRLSSIDGGPSRPAMGLRPGDRPIAWSRDNQSVYVQRGGGAPAIVDRVTLTTGARATVREIAPADVPSLSAISVSDWIDEGRGYAYNYTSVTSTLFLVSSAMH